MTFHVVALPHSQVSEDFSACAFNEKVRKFCIMMKGLGHTVYLYAGELSADVATENIVCITEKERVASLAGKHYTEASFDINLPHWQKFNSKVIKEINKRIKPRDFICVIGGLCHQPVGDAFPEHMTVEFGIGYPGTFAKYRVFESYAWMHTVYCYGKSPEQIDGNFFDDVIPSYFEVDKFSFGKVKDDYYLYVGRLVDRKGWRLAQQVCQKLNKRLIVAGPGKFDGYGEYVGVIDHVKRNELMGKAQAIFVPSLYIEPFGSVHAEAMLCGTPCITTDWGAFVDNVQNGFNGYRCRMFSEFVEATSKVKTLDYQAIRDYAISKFSMDVVAKRYEDYFNRLMTLWDNGFYT